MVVREKARSIVLRRRKSDGQTEIIKCGTGTVCDFFI